MKHEAWVTSGEQETGTTEQRSRRSPTQCDSRHSAALVNQKHICTKNKRAYFIELHAFLGVPALPLEWVPIVVGEGLDLDMCVKGKEKRQENETKFHRGSLTEKWSCGSTTGDWGSVNCEAWKSSSPELRSPWALPHANPEVGHKWSDP